MTFTDWLLADIRVPKGVFSKVGKTEAQHPWWQVMCLTGVDYFSTLGYQPGIAFLAAGMLSPLATLVLVLVTLLGALPVYGRVAAASPNGEGSVGMLERLFPSWGGKSFILVLLGFATTDFVITMTLSAADAAAHVIQNPFTPDWMKSQMALTLILLILLTLVFLKGFKEAVGIAVAFVALYLVLNVVVTVVGIKEVLAHPEVISHWKDALLKQQANPLAMLGICLLLFPKLALGLSGFETGVVVMPLIQATDAETRVRNTRKLLLTAATIMSAFLMATSFITTLLIAPDKFKDGGEANGRALAYLAHQLLGNGFGTLYDMSTILILAFAGASAMTGLLNLLPKYLPRFGMAPEWACASRPLVLIFTAVVFTVTLLFHANVDAQAGAYATGVLVLITSAACAVTLAVWGKWLRWPFLMISLVFVYTTVMNIYQRPEGIKIASFFIGSMVATSLLSRALRSTELRITGVELDARAKELLAEDQDQVIRLVAREPLRDTDSDLDQMAREVRAAHNLDPAERLYFFEVERSDASEFSEKLNVTGENIGGHAILRASSPVIGNAIAAMLMHLEHETGQVPHGYFRWHEGNPIGNLFRFVFFGEGDVAPVTHEVLRRAIEDPKHRPIIHVC